MDLGHRTCLVVGPINQSTRPGASVIPPSYALDNLRSLRVELVGVALVGLLLALRDSGLPHVSTAHTHRIPSTAGKINNSFAVQALREAN